MEKKNYSAKIKDVFGGMRTVRAYFFFFFFLVLVLFSLVIPFDWFLGLGWASNGALFSVYELFFFWF